MANANSHVLLLPVNLKKSPMCTFKNTLAYSNTVTSYGQKYLPNCPLIFKKKNQIWQFCQFFIKKISANLKMQMVVGETDFEIENDRMVGGILNSEGGNDQIRNGILSL